MTSRTKRSNRRCAASVVEFALVAPIFFLALLGVLEYARFLFTMQLMNNASREGARYAVVNINTATTANIQTYVDQYMVGQGANELVGYAPSTSITVYEADPVTGQNTGLSWQNAGWGTGIGVSITGAYHPVTPGLLYLTSSFNITATCVMTTEAN